MSLKLGYLGDCVSALDPMPSLGGPESRHEAFLASSDRMIVSK